MPPFAIVAVVGTRVFLLTRVFIRIAWRREPPTPKE